MTTPFSPSTIRDILQGIANLFVGWILQIGRFFPLLSAKAKVAKTRKEQSRSLAGLGNAMTEVGAGDAYLRQRISSLASSGTAAERAREEEKLGLSGIQAGVPLLNLEEQYQDARLAYQANQTNETGYQSIASKFWPQGPFSWFGLIAGYLLAFFGALLSFAYLAPDSAPKFLVDIVRTPKPEPKPVEKKMPVIISVENKGVKVVLKDATIDRGFESQGTLVAKSDSQIFRIALEITNSTAEPVKYITWRGHHTRRSSHAYLNDDNGLKLDFYTSNDKMMPVGAVYEATIAPGASIVDYLDFVYPAENFKYIELFLPCINLNPELESKETLKLHIPRDAVKKPGDVVKK